jgi:hypothetical protein
MEPHILFALLLIGPIEPTPAHGREVTWTAEFSSQQSCEAAGSALGRKFNTTPSMLNDLSLPWTLCALENRPTTSFVIVVLDQDRVLHDLPSERHVRRRLANFVRNSRVWA